MDQELILENISYGANVIYNYVYQEYMLLFYKMNHISSYFFTIFYELWTAKEADDESVPKVLP